MTITIPGMLYLEWCAKQNSKDVRQDSHPLRIQSSTKWGTAVKRLCCVIKVTNQLILQTLSQIILITQGIQFNIRNNILIIGALRPWMDLTASKSSQKCYKILTIPWGGGERPEWPLHSKSKILWVHPLSKKVTPIATMLALSENWLRCYFVV